MCGILLHVSTKEEGPESLPKWWTEAELLIAERGPDACNTRCDVIRSADAVRLSLCSSVLALRGDEIIRQPVESASGDLLLMWNGEVFQSTIKDFDLEANDSQQLIDWFERSFETATSEEERSKCFAQTLAGVEGPYAVALIDKRRGHIYFGRDPIGRRSLLCLKNDYGLTLASAAVETLLKSTTSTPEEIDCTKLWRLTLSTTLIESIDRIAYRPARLRELAEDHAGHIEIDALNCFSRVLGESVRKRVQLVRPRGDDKVARIAVLFSGGLDCCTLAALAHQHLADGEVIDLVNVAFENPRVLGATHRTNNQDKERMYDVPDRLTARHSLEELKIVAPRRKWRLVEVNVTHDTYRAHRAKIEALMAPCSSVMDLSIAAALYFAARGQGDLHHSTARVLISGLGADELLGGYSRHRKAFQHHGMNGLTNELQMDLDRLPTRNLGRDDRIASSAGKEIRYPFLDQAVIDFLADVPIDAKMQLSKPPGSGDKLLLRDLARSIGLTATSKLTKRAIQFGARSAKMEMGDGRIKGHEKLTASKDGR